MPFFARPGASGATALRDTAKEVGDEQQPLPGDTKANMNESGKYDFGTLGLGIRQALLSFRSTSSVLRSIPLRLAPGALRGEVVQPLNEK